MIDPSAMLPKLHPNVIGTTAAETLFGSKYVVVVGAGTADPGSAGTLVSGPRLRPSA